MEELRQEFLNESVSKLEILQRDLQSRTEEYLPEAFLQELFRRLHTIKGTSQTFNFKHAGHLAHEIEHLLEALRENKITQNTATLSALDEGIRLLLKTLQNEFSPGKNGQSQDFVKKIRSLLPNSEPEMMTEPQLEEIPQPLLNQLSTREINSLASAIQNGSNFFLIEVGFDFSDFDTRLKEFREVLSLDGEIIATSPGLNVDLSRQIGFQLFFISRLTALEITKIIEPFKAILTFESRSLSAKFSNNLEGILAQIVASGEKTARLLEKKIDIQTFADEIPLTPQKLKIIYEILLHLTRNAVDHAIESPEQRVSVQKEAAGKIEISVTNDENKIILRIKDDGRGIKTQEVIEKAVQQGLITPEKVITDDEALEMLFAHGFSTSQTVSKISGRGIGLDIVKEVVDTANGTIKIQTTPGQGTIFEVYLPY